MTYDITFQSIPVLIDGSDTEGKLILADGQLAAVIVRLDSSSHASEHFGQWYLEAGFGKCATSHPPMFKTPGQAGEWVLSLERHT